jgi:hypothetical protein
MDFQQYFMCIELCFIKKMTMAVLYGYSSSEQAREKKLQGMTAKSITFKEIWGWCVEMRNAFF